MVREALQHRQTHLAKRGDASARAGLDFTPVGLGLVKYFNLALGDATAATFSATAANDCWRHVEGPLR